MQVFNPGYVTGGLQIRNKFLVSNIKLAEKENIKTGYLTRQYNNNKISDQLLANEPEKYYLDI